MKRTAKEIEGEVSEGEQQPARKKFKEDAAKIKGKILKNYGALKISTDATSFNQNYLVYQNSLSEAKLLYNQLFNVLKEQDLQLYGDQQKILPDIDTLNDNINELFKEVDASEKFAFFNEDTGNEIPTTLETVFGYIDKIITVLDGIYDINAYRMIPGINQEFIKSLPSYSFIIGTNSKLFDQKKSDALKTRVQAVCTIVNLILYFKFYNIEVKPTRETNDEELITQVSNSVNTTGLNAYVWEHEIRQLLGLVSEFNWTTRKLKLKKTPDVNNMIFTPQLMTNNGKIEKQEPSGNSGDTDANQFKLLP